MYVVMGATGNTGSVVAKRLLAKGQRVRAIGRSVERLRGLAAKGAEAFVGEVTDSAALTKAFMGATAAYVIIPPDEKNPDPRAFQDRVTESIATALENSQIEYAVSLSSIGADKPDQTGPVVGLHHLEQRLNRIAGLNVLHLRAGYFMENTLAQIGIIRALGMAAGPLGSDVKLPMIASRDIGAFAAEELLRLDFDEPERELLGQRDLDDDRILCNYRQGYRQTRLDLPKIARRPNSHGSDPDGFLHQHGQSSLGNVCGHQLRIHAGAGTTLFAEHDAHFLRSFRGG